MHGVGRFQRLLKEGVQLGDRQDIRLGQGWTPLANKEPARAPADSLAGDQKGLGSTLELGCAFFLDRDWDSAILSHAGDRPG
jgi:hypothetical protein